MVECEIFRGREYLTLSFDMESHYIFAMTDQQLSELYFVGFVLLETENL